MTGRIIRQHLCRKESVLLFCVWIFSCYSAFSQSANWQRSVLNIAVVTGITPGPNGRWIVGGLLYERNNIEGPFAALLILDKYGKYSLLADEFQTFVQNDFCNFAQGPGGITYVTGHRGWGCDIILPGTGIIYALDSNAKSVWTKEYPDIENSMYSDDSAFLFTDMSGNPGMVSGNYMLRMDSSGRISSSRSFPGDTLKFLVPLPGGKCILFSRTLMRKLDQYDSLLWVRKTASFKKVSALSNSMFAGLTTGGTGIPLFDTSGMAKRTIAIDTSVYSYAKDITTEDGYIYLLLIKKDLHNGVIAKLDSTGRLHWEKNIGDHIFPEYIALNKGKIAVAGEDISDKSQVRISIKVTDTFAAFPRARKDIGIVKIEVDNVESYWSSISNRSVVSGHFRAYVKNFGADTIHKFTIYAANYTSGILCRTNNIDLTLEKVLLGPGDSLKINVGNFQAETLAKGKVTLNVCASTSSPDDEPDAHPENDRGCETITYTSSDQDINPERQPKVYPNPVSDYMYLEMDTQTETAYTIYDMNGRLISTARLSPGKTHSVSVAKLPEGMYILKLVSDSYSTSVYFIRE